MPKICIATIKGVAPYSSSRAHEAEKQPKETADAYEHRTWREKMHVDAGGDVFIPAMSWKMAVDAASKMLGDKIPGKRNATFTKFFTSGVLVFDNAKLGIKAAAVEGVRVHANVDGVRGSGKRVWRIFPEVPEWSTVVKFHVLADEITPDVFERTLAQAGSFVGIGRFRAEKGGLNGRFVVERVRWE